MKRYTGPTADQVIAARKAAGHTQEQAAELVYMWARQWQKWESGETKMKRGLFELFELKTGSKILE